MEDGNLTLSEITVPDEDYTHCTLNFIPSSQVQQLIGTSNICVPLRFLGKSQHRVEGFFEFPPP